MEPLRTNRARGQSPTHKGLPDKHSHTAPVAHTRVGDRALLLRRIGLTIGIIVCAQALYLLDLDDTPNTNPSDDRVGLSSDLLIRQAAEHTRINSRLDTTVVSSTASTTLPVPTTPTPTLQAPGTTLSTTIPTDPIVTANQVDQTTQAQRVDNQVSNTDTTDYNAPWELPVYTNGKQTSKVQMHPRVNFCVGLNKHSPEIAGGATLTDVSLGCFQSSTAVRPPGIPVSSSVAETAAACTATCSKGKFAFAGLTTADTTPSCVCANELGARADFEPPDHTEWRNASVAGVLERCRKVAGGGTIAFFRIGKWPTAGALGDIALPSPNQPRPVITVFLWANPRLAAIFRTCRLSRMSTEYDYDVFDLRHQVRSIFFSLKISFHTLRHVYQPACEGCAHDVHNKSRSCLTICIIFVSYSMRAFRSGSQCKPSPCCSPAPEVHGAENDCV